MMRRTMLLLVSMIVFLALPACSSTAASPAPTAQAYEPPAVQKGEQAVIMINMPASADNENIIKRLNSALESKGQHVSFQMRTSTFFTGGGDFLQKVKEELVAGKPAAAAYLLLYEESRTFFNDGLTMDVTELVKQYAPVYFLKYAAIFDKTLSGIPVCIYDKPMWSRTALMLRSDYLSAGGEIARMDDLFQFLDKSVAAQATVLADPRTLVDQWALERGYYPLGPFGVDGYLYAALNDPQCTPVPLESIPGLEDFLKTIIQYYAKGSLEINFETFASKEPIGFVKDLGDYFIHNPYSWMSWIPGEFTPIILSPDRPSSFTEPYHLEELAIPATCPREVASEVARFVEWYNGSQENYDVVIYGQQGVDFCVSGARFAPMKEGRVLDPKPSSELLSQFFSWPGAMFLSNANFYRLPMSAPANIEKLYDDALLSGPHTEASGRLNYREMKGAMNKLGGNMQEISEARNGTLSVLIWTTPASYTNTLYSKAMDELAKAGTGRLVEGYKKAIGEILAK